MFDTEERSILTRVPNSRRENKNKLTAKTFLRGSVTEPLIFLNSNYSLLFMCIIIDGLLIVSVQHNERAYHSDENGLYLYSTLLRCDGLFISE